MLRTNNMVAMALLGVIACLSQSACSGETHDQRESSTVQVSMAPDDHKVLAELYADDARWSAFRKKIASGDQAALEAGMKLYSSADGGARGMLMASFGEALKAAATRVLALAKQNRVSIDAICKGPDVDDNRFNTFEQAVEELTAREHAAASVSQDEFKTERESCLGSLGQARIDLAKFFEVGDGVAKP